MNAPLRIPVRFDVQGLVRAIAQSPPADSFSPALNPTQWELLGTYMQPFTLMQGQTLIERHAQDRTVYLIESGSLSVHYEDDKARVRMTVVGPGSAVGEGAFFTHAPRAATVQAASASKVWCLTPIRFAELGNRQPAIALEIALALGSLVVRRLGNKPKRVAVT